MYIKNPDCKTCVRYNAKKHKEDPNNYVCSANRTPFPKTCWDSSLKDRGTNITVEDTNG